MTLLLAQCVMCARTAAAQNLERAVVLNQGILILLIPPLVGFAAILVMARRRGSESGKNNSALNSFKQEVCRAFSARKTTSKGPFESLPRCFI